MIRLLTLLVLAATPLETAQEHLKAGRLDEVLFALDGQSFSAADKPKAAAWLNPEPRRIWNAPTVAAIRRVFPMFELTLDGLSTAVEHLRGARPMQPEPGLSP